MATMDFWYERAIYEMVDLNEEATELRRAAAETMPSSRLEPPAPDDD